MCIDATLVAGHGAIGTLPGEGQSLRVQADRAQLDRAPAVAET